MLMKGKGNTEECQESTHIWHEKMAKSKGTVNEVVNFSYFENHFFKK